MVQKTGQRATQQAHGLVGRAPVPPPSNAPKLRLPAVANFIFLFSPARWDIRFLDGEPIIIPQLRRFHFEPGVSGVEQVMGRDDGNPVRALASQQERGWFQIANDLTCTAFGEQHKGYVHVFDGYQGPVHLSVWERPYVLGASVQVDVDDDGWTVFCRDLVGKTIPAPDKNVLKALELRMKRGMQRRVTADTASSRATAELYERKLGAFLGVADGRR